MSNKDPVPEKMDEQPQPESLKEDPEAFPMPEERDTPNPGGVSDSQQEKNEGG